MPDDGSLDDTVAPTEPPTEPPRPSGFDETLAPTEPPTEPMRPSGLEATLAPGASGLAAASNAASEHNAELTVVDRSHYRLMGELARGGLGRIMIARDRRTGRMVAIKEMLGTSSEIAKRFMREALLTANLQHPAIVPVYELGQWPDGEPFYAMKLVEGHAFEDVLKSKDTLAKRLAQLPTMLAVCEALAYAHGQAIIHRDLKPANVLVGAFGETVVIDWGLAKRIADEDAPESSATPLPKLAAEGQTIAGAVMGTPAYMAPEQARGDDLDPRADVYALGAMLYHLLAGHAPYADQRPKSAHQLVDWVTQRPPTPLATLAPEAPPDLVAIANKAMAREPGDRYPSASELAEDLRRFTTGQLVGAHRYDWKTLLRRWLRKNSAAVTVGATLLVILIVTAIVSVRSILTEQARAEQEAATAEHNLGTALAEKGDAAERDKQWGKAAMYYQASLLRTDDPKTRFAAGRAEARTIAPVVRHTGHRGGIHGLALVGGDAITVDGTGQVHRWSLADGHLIAAWTAPTALHAVATDGSRIAVAGDDGTIRMLDDKLAPRAEYRAHGSRVYALAFSRDGTLASAGFDKTIRLIDRAGQIRTLTGHGQRVYHVAFSPDGKRLASASDDRTARLWDIAGGRELLQISGVAGGITVVAWFPDGDRLFTSGWDRKLRMWDATTGVSIQNTTGGVWEDSTSVHAGTVAIGGRLLVTGGFNKKVKVWDPATQSLVADLDGHGELVSAVAVTPDGRWLVSASHDDTARVWDLGAALRLARLGHQRQIRHLVWSPDGTRIVTSAGDTTVRLWDAASGQELQRMSPRVDCTDGALFAVLPGGEAFGAGCADGNVQLWRISDRHPITLAGSGRGLRHAVVALDGTWIAAGQTEGWMHVWDTATGAIRVSKQIHDHNIYGLRVLGDGTLLTASLDNTVRRSTPALETLDTWRAPGIDGLLDAALDPRRRFVVAGGDGFDVFRWDLTKPGAPAAALAGHRGPVWSVDVSPDGAWVASASSDGTIRLWDTTRWFEPGYKSDVVRGPKGGVLAVAFSPDGTRLLSGHQRGAAIVWDLARRVPLRRLGSSEAGEEGDCRSLESVPWNDSLEKAIVLRTCLEPSGLERIARSTHLELDGVELRESW